MEKKFDLISLLKAIHYETCDVCVATEEQYANDDWVEIPGGEDLYDMLTDLDAEGVEYIRANYKYVAWHYSDNFIPQLRIEYGVEDDSMYFYYDKLDFKTKYTLVNILKSQHDWECVGISVFDRNTDEVLEGEWWDECNTENDMWLHRFEELCDEHVAESKCADFFKGQEKEDGKAVDVLDLVIVTK